MPTKLPHLQALSLGLLALAGCRSGGALTSAPAPAVEVVVLGVAQDAGLPHIGCERPTCTRARAEGHRERVACLGIRGRTGWWLLDATPDLPAQLAAMGEASGGPVGGAGALPDGIFLTHAHVGHYTGLMYLGREALGARGVPVWCGPRMQAFLEHDGPWSQLVDLGQVDLQPLRDGVPVELEPGLSLTPLAVPHRDEFSGTFAFVVRVEGGGSVLYVPDIDGWEEWEHGLEEFLVPGATLLLDGTFYSGDELPGRDLDEIPHPLVSRTLDRVEGLAAWSRGPAAPRVGFIHLNHSNPLWDRGSPARQDLEERGFFVAREGLRLDLSAASAAR